MKTLYSIKHELIQVRVTLSLGEVQIERKSSRMLHWKIVKDATGMPLRWTNQPLFEAIRQANLYAEAYLRGKI